MKKVYLFAAIIGAAPALYLYFRKAQAEAR